MTRPRMSRTTSLTLTPSSAARVCNAAQSSSGMRMFRFGVLGWLGMSVDNDGAGTDVPLGFQWVRSGVASGARFADDACADGFGAAGVALEERGEAVAGGAGGGHCGLLLSGCNASLAGVLHPAQDPQTGDT